MRQLLWSLRLCSGYAVKTASTATYAIAMGSGYGTTQMTHSVTNSLGVGFNSNVPTFFVGPGAGTSGSLGNVGIGTTSPAQLLHVTGRARFDLSTAASTTGRMYVTRAAAANQECLLSFCTGGTSTYDWVAGTYNNGATGNSDWILNSWNSRAITAMYSNGNVAIGSTGISNDVPLAKLHVGGDFMVGTDGTAASSAAYIKNSSGAYTTSLTPDYTWYKDSTTGIFHNAAKMIGFTSGGSEKMRIDASGNIDINATSKIYLNSNGDSNHGLGVYGTSNDTTKFAGKAVNGPVLFGYGGGALATNVSGTKKIALLWDANGYVHIGPTFTNSTHTTAALTVGGDIIGKSLYVTNNNWSDFVFDKTYKLMPLSEVEKFYTANHHLPDVPTEKDIQQNGDNVGQTDAILLQKIEELTLYLVQQQKQIDELKKLLADKK